MALQINLPDSNVGVAFETAYARIVALKFDTRSGLVEIAVDIHATQAAREAGKAPVAGGVYSGIVGVDMPSLDQDIPGVRQTLYTYLKTLPQFAGAVDC